MTNTCEQTKHSIQNILFMWCQQTPLLGKHKLRSQALVDEIRQPPSIHNIGTYPPPNGHAGCDTTHRLTHKRPHLCQSSRSPFKPRTVNPHIETGIAKDWPLVATRPLPQPVRVCVRRPAAEGRHIRSGSQTDSGGNYKRQ